MSAPRSRLPTIAASLWSVPAARHTTEAARLRAAGIGRFHWDLADGSMSRGGGFDASRAKSLAPAGASNEAHLMLRDPRPVLADWRWCDAIAVHASQPHWREAVAMIAAEGSLPVIAVTDAAELSLAPVECGVLVMTIAPGEAGGSFDEAAFAVVEQARTAGHPHIGVDGSMTPDRGRRFAAAGATVIVSGTGLTSSADPASWIDAVGSPP